MASSIAVAQSRPTDAFRRIFGLVPGLLLLVAVGYAGKYIERSISLYGRAHHLRLPSIEYVLWAILIGLVIANTVGVPEVCRPGLATYEFWLKAGIVLLGSRFLLGDVLKLGGVSVVLVAIEIAVSLAFMTALGRAFGLKPKLTSLLAVGSSICGVSAIIATQGAIDADEEDSSFAIAAILTLGVIALFVFPLVGHWLRLNDLAYGLWAGLGIDNTAEVTAAGTLYSDSALPADVRRSRPAHECSRNVEARRAPIRGGSARQGRHRAVHAGPGSRRQSLPALSGARWLVVGSLKQPAARSSSSDPAGNPLH